MTEQPIVPDPRLIRTAAEVDAVDQRILDDLRDNHAQTGCTVSGPFYPEAMGALLGKLFNPEPTAGPPWTHTVEPPRCDLEDCCDDDEPCACVCHRVQPTHTITFDTSEAADA